MTATPFDPALLAALADARHVAVLTGAGISAESGIPTFRDPQDGLWSRFRPEDLATRAAFARDPKLVWSWYEWRRSLVGGAGPNDAHRALVTLAARVPRLTLVTQNVDNLHHEAGSTDVIELHGNIRRNKCFDAERGKPGECATGADAPRCTTCGGFVRPDVVWFGEGLPTEALARAEAAAKECDLFFVIGTSVAVFPAAALPGLALQAGKPVIEINREPTALSRATPFSLRGKAGEILPALIRATWPSLH